MQTNYKSYEHKDATEFSIDDISGFSHSFDTGIAATLGLHAAIVYNHLLYWLQHNYIEGKNFENDKVWTYNSYDEMAKYMPYFTRDQVRRSIEDLVRSGLIIKGNFNKNKFDRTAWYTVPDQSIITCSNKHYDKANSPNADGEFAKSKRRPRHISYNTLKEPGKDQVNNIPPYPEPSDLGELPNGSGGVASSTFSSKQTPRDCGTNPRAKGTNPRATENNPRSIGSNPRSVAENPKKNFRDYVQLNQVEHDKLLADYGQDKLNQMLDILDAYKGSSGKRYKSDYHTLLPSGWVHKRWLEEKGSQNGQVLAPHRKNSKLAFQTKKDDWVPTPIAPSKLSAQERAAIMEELSFKS